MELAIGTAEGLLVGSSRVGLEGDVRHVTRGPGGWWALVRDAELWRSHDLDAWEQEAVLDLRANCLLGDETGLWIGTSLARLFRFTAGVPTAVEGFDRAPGRGDWYTPWGGPPDTRSLAGGSGTIFANVHVGGILRSTDGGDTWAPTLDIDEDVHQVQIGDTDAIRVLAASARGLAVSEDGGSTWQHARSGLHASYARAVACSDEYDFLSASSGPSGGEAALYRRRRSESEFQRCSEGLPRWFDDNINTHCLIARGSDIGFGVEGTVYLSSDEGDSWAQAARAGRIRCLTAV